MPYSNFSELKTAIENWLNETGNQTVIDRVADFVTLGEEYLRSTKDFDPRYLETRETIATTSGVDTVALPTGFKKPIDLYLDTSPKVKLIHTVQSDMDGYTSSAKPIKYVIEGNNVRLSPTPDSAYNISLLYIKFPTGLSVSNTTNLILQNQPNLYLWVSCLQGAIYLRDTDQIDIFSKLVNSSIENQHNIDLNINRTAPMYMINNYQMPLIT